MFFLARYTLLAAMLSFVCVVVLMMTSLWLSQPTNQADVALVLGSKVQPDGTLSPQLLARMEQALVLDQAVPSITYVVSGGTGIEGIDEATAMADFLKVEGIANDRIMQDRDGINTLESVRFIAENFPTETKLIVVSQFFHIPRAVLALRKAGFTNVSGAAVPPMFWRDIYSTAREIPALIMYACCRSL